MMYLVRVVYAVARMCNAYDLCIAIRNTWSCGSLGLWKRWMQEKQWHRECQAYDDEYYSMKQD